MAADGDDAQAVEQALQDPTLRSSAVRSRFLTDPSKTLEHNAWDDVEWDEERLAAAKAKVAADTVTLSEEEIAALDTEAWKHWNTFYESNGNKFFKERNYLHVEFPFLIEGDGERVVLEVGCGTGASVWPLARAARPGILKVKCFDFAPSAVELVKTADEYDELGNIHAFVWDIAKSPIPYDDVAADSVDYALMIFVLSAIKPEEVAGALAKLYEVIKPGGRIMLRDYGRYDLAQLRFKQGRKLDDHFYVRGDGTQVYFFTREELAAAFEAAGFVTAKNVYDRRLIVNRKTKQTMYRVWLQAEFVKPASSA